MADAQWKNKLYFGDNLDILRDHIADESVDLIYLDPPFNSNATYNVLFAEKNGAQSAAQITAFEDTWHWNIETEEAYTELVQDSPRKLADLIQALRSFLGQNDMMAYLVMMAARLEEMQRVLKSTGSIYLHCDPTASHYLKLLMDGVFGPQQFRNEVIWKRTSAHSSATRYGPVHDVLLFYTKTGDFVWNPQHQPFDEEYIASHYRNVDEQGRAFTLSDLTAAGTRKGSSGQPWRGYDPASKGNHWKFTLENLEHLDANGRIYWPLKGGWPRYRRYLDEQRGVPLQDVWVDIDPINALAVQRLGFPTQKPDALLGRVVCASSPKDGLVLDPFCGCGTTVAVAEKLGRRWIGIDITHLAITLMRHRLEDAFGTELSPYEVVGDPKDLASAQALAQHDRYQFQWWAFGKVAARPGNDKKKGPDAGVDGIIRFFDDNSGKAKTILVQVKSGGVKRGDVATLKGDMEREKAVIGAFITLEDPTGPMRKEAASAGFYEPQHFPGLRYPRIQILTIDDLLAGKQIEYPRLAPEGTFKRAERKRKTVGEQPQLL